ncbi:charged multivesicular body protein 6, partial [Phenoliferia sp. Uapishka_3]
MGQSSSAVKITTQDRSILDLKLQRDKLKKYQVRVRKPQIQAVLSREHDIAKEALAAGNKAKALTALRQRKYQETLLSQTDGQLETLQKLVSSIEFSLIEKDVLFGLKQGNAVLKEIHKEMDLESVEKLMSDTAEGIAYQNEIDAMLSNKMSAAEEEEVLEELAALQAEQVKSRLPDTPLFGLPERAQAPQVEEEDAAAATRREGRQAIAA